MKRHQLAASKKLDVDVYAEYTGETWCATDLRLRFEAGNLDLYTSDAFAVLTRKVGKVIESQCETAQRAVLHGYARGMDKMSLKGTLSLSEGWSFRRN
jgi:hypothetical protein